MDHRCTSVTLYSPQAQIVLDVLDRDGICFSRREYVQKKYEESAPVFLSAYDWFVKAAEAHIPKPQGAEYPYWAFGSPENVDLSAGGRVLHIFSNLTCYINTACRSVRQGMSYATSVTDNI